MQRYGQHVPDVRRIAVLRANALGDFIFTLPALEALRSAYPDAEIVVLGLPWHREFLTGRPGPVDRVIVVPPCRGVGMPEDFENDDAVLDRFFAQMREEQFDLAIQLHGGGRFSNPFVKRLGARMTVGLKSEDAEPLDRWIPYVYFQQEIMRFLEVVALVDARPVVLEPRVTVTEEDREEARRIVPSSGQPLVVIHPGASDPRRRWPVEKFAVVGDSMAGSGANIAVIGAGESERLLVNGVVDAMEADALPLWERLSIGGLAALLERSQLVICNDSGPLHLAAAVGASTVGIYWCFNLLNAGELTRTRHRPLLSWRLECPACGMNCLAGQCDHQDSFVADVPVDAVLDSALAMLAAERSGGRPSFKNR